MKYIRRAIQLLRLICTSTAVTQRANTVTLEFPSTVDAYGVYQVVSEVLGHECGEMDQ